MNLLNRLFGEKNKLDRECPRCLGKGNVDDDDIARLGKELEWMPASCAYCVGLGKVSRSFLRKISADESYLTTSLSDHEREQLINRDSEILVKAANFKENVQNFEDNVLELYIKEKLKVEAIAETFLSWQKIVDKESLMYQEKKEDLKYSIDKVLKKYNRIKKDKYPLPLTIEDKEWVEMSR